MKTKMKYFFSSIGPICLFSIPVVGLASIIATSEKNNLPNRIPNIDKPYTLKIDGRQIQFNSVLEAADYLIDIYSPKFYLKNSKSNLQYFNSINDVISYIKTNSDIKMSETVLWTTEKIKNSIDLDNELIRIPNDSLSKTTTIYRTSFGGFSSSWEEAVSTYNRNRIMYFFNGVYFNSIEDLEDYLRKIYYYNENSQGFQDKQMATYYKFQNSNIFFDKAELELPDIKNTNFYKSVISQVKTFIKINDDYVSLDELNNSKFNSPIFDYTTLDANNGEQTFLVDVQSDSPAELIGPRYVKSDGTINLITDVNNWFATNLESLQQTTDPFQQLSDLFFNLFILKNEKYPIAIIGNELKADNYFAKLENQESFLYKELENFIEKLDNAKSSSSFEKILLSYHFLIQNMIEQKKPEELIIATKQYFQSCLEAIDKIIYTIIPSNLLKNNVNNEIFSLAKSFNFTSSTYNFNIQNNYLYTLINNYKLLKSAIVATITGLNNELNSFINYNTLDSETRALFKRTKMIEMEEIAKIVNVEMNKEYSNELLQVYNFFASNTFDQAEKFVVENTEIAKKIIEELKPISDLISESFDSATADGVASMLQGLISIEGVDYSKIKKMFNINNYKLALLQQEEFKKIGKISKDAKTSIKNILTSRISSANHKTNPLKILGKIDPKTISAIENKYKFNAKDVIQSANNLEFSSLKNQSGKDISTHKQRLNIVNLKSIFKKIGSISGILDSAFTIANFIKDAFVPKVETKIYQFQTTDQSFYWTGGYEKTLLFGLINLESSTPKDIKFIPPIEIIKPQLKTQYYFNQRVFDTLNDLTKYQTKILKDLLITAPEKVPSELMYYQFSNLPNYFSSMEELVLNIKEQVKQDIIPVEKYWTDDNLKLSSSQIDLVNTRIEQIKKDVSKNHKLLIVPIPKFSSQKINYNDLTSFTPTNIYTIENGLQTSKNNLDFLIKNYSEIESDSINQGTTIEKIVNSLLQEYAFFKNLDSKVINSFVFVSSVNKSFDEIDEIIYKTKIYQYHYFNEKTQKIELHQFLSQDKMINSIIEKLGIKSTKSPEHEKIIFYQDRKYTYDELINHLLKNT